MREIDKILNEDEKVLWEGKPVFWPYFLGSLFGMIVVVIFFILIPLLFLILFGFLIIVAIFALVYALLVYKNLHYAITDKRVIFQGGLIGRDFQTIDFDQVTNAEVNVDIVDKIFGGNTGTIIIQSAGMFTQTKLVPIPKPVLLSHIPNPYEVFKFFKKASFDVKADIQYPNKFRPKENVGYNTEYQGKMKK